MFNINLDKVILAINRLAEAIEEATKTMKKMQEIQESKEKNEISNPR